MLFYINGKFFNHGSLYDFSGTFDHAGLCRGELSDQFGDSVLYNVRLDGESLQFDKKYRDRDYIVYYIFVRNGEFWTGRWKSPNISVGEGYANCITIPVPDKFSDYRATKAFFDKTARLSGDFWTH